jgi:hypothetical protein
VLHSDRVCRTFFEPERPRFPSRCSHPVIGVTSRVNRRRAFSGGFPRNRPPCRGSARSGSTPVTRANSQGHSGGSGYCGWSRRRRVLPAKPVSALCWWWSDRAADRPCCGRSRVAWPPRPGRPGGLRAAHAQDHQADATLGQVHLDRQQLSRRPRQPIGLRHHQHVASPQASQALRVLAAHSVRRNRTSAPAPDGRLGGDAVRRLADHAAHRVASVIEAVRADQGADVSLQGLARALTELGVATPRGGAWTATAVRRVLARV